MAYGPRGAPVTLHRPSARARRQLAVTAAAAALALTGCNASTPAAPTAGTTSTPPAAANVVGAVANSAQTLAALNANPQLDAAFTQAQSCQRLRAIQTPGRMTSSAAPTR